MYISVGAGRFVNDKDIIGIFDLDITSQSNVTRKYLKEAEKKGNEISATEDIPKSFVVMNSGEIYISQPLTATLIKRIEENY